MATVTGFTAERMLVIENSTVVDGEVQGDNLILQTRGGTPIDAGNVRGPQGDVGPVGPQGVVGPVGPVGPKGDASTVPGPPGTVAVPLVIPDPVGDLVPTIEFKAGDGTSGTYVNPHDWKIDLYNDAFRIVSGRAPASVVAQFVHPDAGTYRLDLNDWTVNRDSDGQFRIKYGDVSRLSISTGGIIYGQTQYVLGGIHTNWYSGPYYIFQAQAGGAIRLQNASGGGYYDFSHQIAAYVTQPPGNYWNQRSLVIGRNGGGGEAGIGFGNYVTGQTAGIQLFVGGNPGFYFTQGNNASLINVNASQFTVISGRESKNNIRECDIDDPLDVISRLRPVRYNRNPDPLCIIDEPVRAVQDDDPGVVEPSIADLQYHWEDGPPKRDEFGLIAEEVAELIPEAVADGGDYGPMLDYQQITTVLIAAVQRLSARVEELESAR